MSETTIRFEDGAAYELGMGGWSRLAGEIFLDWLAPRRNVGMARNLQTLLQVSLVIRADRYRFATAQGQQI